MADDTNVVTFRRSTGAIPPPPLPLAPRPPAPAADARTGGQEAVSVGSMSRMPGVEAMGVPLALMMPPIPAIPGAGDPDGSDDGEEGMFAPPPPEDPDHPSARDTLALAMALVTALGVAAAQGLWHRARHRQALADQARANADKAAGKAAGAGHGGGHGGGHRGGGGGSRGGGSKGSGGLLTGSRQGGHGGSGSRHGAGSQNGGKKRSDRPHGGSHGGGHGGLFGGGHKAGVKGAPKAAKGGRAAPGHGPSGSKRRKRGKGKGGLGSDGPCVWTSERRPGGKRDRGGRRGDKRGRDRRERAQGTPKRRRPGPTLTWKAAKRGPGPDGDRAITGRRRWRGRGKDTSQPKWRRRSRTARLRSWAWRFGKKLGKRTWKSSTAWLKRWRARHKAASEAGAADGATGGAGGGREERESWKRKRKGKGEGEGAPPPPPPWSESMRPPPDTDPTEWVTVERVDGPRPRQEEPAVLAGAPAAGWPELPPPPQPAPEAAAGSDPSTTSALDPTATSVPDQMNGVPMSPLVPAPRTGTQYADADLTIYDVIEADADMAEEITEGVYEAQATAHGCERLMTKLEALHASIVELKVPGVLEGMLLRLMEKTGSVQAKAQAIAATLPAASEAIAVAGANAAARHKVLADVTRDAGHVRPAEREYHDE